MVGRIYLAKIYFTDLSEYKIRPVLVLRVYGEDCLCLPLTSNLKREGFLLGANDLADGFFEKTIKGDLSEKLHTALLYSDKTYCYSKTGYTAHHTS